MPVSDETRAEGRSSDSGAVAPPMQLELPSLSGLGIELVLTRQFENTGGRFLHPTLLVGRCRPVPCGIFETERGCQDDRAQIHVASPLIPSRSLLPRHTAFKTYCLMLGC